MKSGRILAIASVLAVSCSGGESDEPSAKVETALKAAAGAEELYSTLHGDYTDSVEELAAAAGSEFPEGVELQVTLEETASYCIQASEGGSGVWHLSRDLPVIGDGGC